MLWLNKSGKLIMKDGKLVDCDKCPCSIDGYLFSINLRNNSFRNSGLYIKPQTGCSEEECIYDFSDYYCIDSIWPVNPDCDRSSEPPCPFHWHVVQYPYYDSEPPQWVIDSGITWKIENETLYIWERLVKIGVARTTIVFSIPEGCEFIGGRVCRYGYSDYIDVEKATLSISGNRATLTYSLLEAVGEASFTLALLSTCSDLTIDNFSISGLNNDCWETAPEYLPIEVVHKDLKPIIDEWSDNPDPACQYVFGEEDEFE